MSYASTPARAATRAADGNQLPFLGGRLTAGRAAHSRGASTVSRPHHHLNDTFKCRTRTEYSAGLVVYRDKIIYALSWGQELSELAGTEYVAGTRSARRQPWT